MFLKYYQFCPGLNILVSADSAKEAEQEMYKLIESSLKYRGDTEYAHFPIQSVNHQINRITDVK